MPVQLGSTILLPKTDGGVRHLWVVITPPVGLGQVAMVNITTKRENSDLTVVLNKGDHPFIQHPSVVYYSDARIVPIVALEAAINSGRFGTHREFTLPILSKIQDGVLASDFTPKKIKEFCRPLI